MPKAIGCSQTGFLSKKIGNLCRGKEWWIETQSPQREQSLNRLVISGVELQDERAREAKRGLVFSGRSLEEFIHMLAQGYELIACMEDGNPQTVPEQASGVEHYQMSKLGFAWNTYFVRWELRCTSLEDIALALDLGADVFLFDATLATAEEQTRWKDDLPLFYGEEPRTAVLSAQLKKDVHRLNGGRVHAQASARYVADAIWDVLENCAAVLLLHEDKHERCIGLYSQETLGMLDRVEDFCERSDVLFVPFSIPPMLARWDRAVRDLRRDWDEETRGEFPIPMNPEDKEEASVEENSQESEEANEDKE